MAIFFVPFSLLSLSGRNTVCDAHFYVFVCLFIQGWLVLDAASQSIDLIHQH